VKRLLRLDCENIDSVYESVVAFSGLNRERLSEQLDEFESSDGSKLYSQERWEFFADWLGIGQSEFEVCWFHGTRTANPDSFLKGVLPLDARLEGIWNELQMLLEDQVTAIEWAKLRKAVERNNYGMGKIGRDTWESRRRDQGPYGFLIKQYAMTPMARAQHHYTRVPEVVDMILRGFPVSHREELKRRYFQCTKPCIVKFTSKRSDRQLIGCAADYLLHHRKKWSLECFLPPNFDGHGQAVSSERIVYSVHLDTEKCETKGR
jgi:hypothetical protein